jgi:hypothetical protein
VASNSIEIQTQGQRSGESKPHHFQLPVLLPAFANSRLTLNNFCSLRGL